MMLRCVAGLPSATTAFTEKFKFQGPPNFVGRPWKELEASPIEFKEGVFALETGEIPIMSFTLYNDAISAQCRLSDDAEVVLDGIMKWARDTLALRDFQRPPTRLYMSAIVVAFEKSVEAIFAKWNGIQEIFAPGIKNLYGVEDRLAPARITINCDPITTPRSVLVSEFLIERRLGEPYGENRFFVSGPLRTNDLIAATERLEKLL